MAHPQKFKIIAFMFIFAWTVYLTPEAQVGPFNGKEKIRLVSAVNMEKFYIMGKTKNSKKIYYIPYSSVLLIIKEK